LALAQQTIDIGVSPETVFGVISDYEAYPEFLQLMEHVRVVRSEGHVVDAEFTLHLITRLEYTLRLVGTPYTGLSWTLLGGAFRANAGGWTLEPLPDGTTRAHYRLNVEVGMFVPGAIVTRLVGRDLPQTLRAFKARAESIGADS